MDRHLMGMAIIGVIVLGVVGVITGTYLTVATTDAGAGAACIGIGSAALGALAGFLAAPRQGRSTDEKTDSVVGDSAVG